MSVWQQQLTLTPAVLLAAEELMVIDAPCFDCQQNTADEWYIVHDQVWRDAGMTDGYLCIGCLEARLGRELGPIDFPPLPVNDPARGHSERLYRRLGR